MPVVSFLLPNFYALLYRHAAPYLLLCAAFMASAVANTCTGNIVEFNLGLVGNFMANQTFSSFGVGQTDALSAIRFVDLDFQSTHNPSIPWGPSMYFPFAKPNPCLRVRPILIQSGQLLNGSKSPNAPLLSQIHSIWNYGNDTVDAFIHWDWVSAELASHAEANSRVVITLKDLPEFQLEPAKYPYSFRYAPSTIDKAGVYYEYYQVFGFRAIHYVYSQHQKIMDTFSYFITYWDERNQSSNKLLGYNIPSENATWRPSLISKALIAIRDSPMRLVVMDVDSDGSFENAAGCLEWYAICIVKAFQKYGVWAPNFQLITNVDTAEVLKSIANSTTLLYDSAFHFVSPTHVQAVLVSPSYLERLQNFIIEQIMRWGLMDFPSMRSRYGIGQWREPYLSTWDTEFQPIISQILQTVPTGPALEIDILHRSWVSDVMVYFMNAWNDIMNTGQITHKSQVTQKMLGDAVSNTTPQFTALGGTYAFKLSPPSKAPNLFYGVYQVQNRSITPYEAAPNCCQDKFYLGGVLISVRVTPRWASGEVSNMPPASLANCSPGMYSADSLCEWCPEGRYSDIVDATECTLCSRGKYAKAQSSKCNDCEEGKVASELQMAKCDSCQGGTYAPSKGMSACTLCEEGRYSSAMKATSCFSCGGDLTTPQVGSLISDDCVCPKSTFSRSFQKALINQSSTTSCEKCMNGLECEAGWPDSWNAKGSLVSQTKSGFFVLNSDPFSVYKCCPGENCDDECPGGPPEYCIGGREGLVCDKCIKGGYHISGKECKECPPYLKLMLLICAAASCALCTAGYYATNGVLTVNADNPLAFFLFVGLVVTSVQVFGVIKDLNIPWPQAFSSFFSGSSSAFALDANSVSIDCAVGSNVTIIYLCQVLIPHFLLIEICFLAQLSKILAVSFGKPGKAWEKDKTMNVAGQLMQALFIAFCVIAIKPMQCFDHPNGTQSVLTFPRVLCYEGGTHTDLMILAGCICVSFLLPFVAWCVYGCVAAPRQSSIGNALFLKRYRFLLYRFRPDCWWWGLVFILRQTLLAFATVVPADNPHAQLLYTGGTLAIYSIFAARFWPWICDELSIIDVGTMLILVLLMLTAAQYLPEPDPNKGRFGLLLAMSLAFVALLTRYLMLLLMSVCAKGVFGEFAADKPNRIRVCELWLKWLEYAKHLNNKEIVEIVCKMNAFDRKSLFNLITVWNAVTASKEGQVGKSVEGAKWRLKGLQSKTKITEEKCKDVAHRYRGTTAEFESSNVQNECEHNVGFPRSFRVIASSGVALLLNTEKDGVNGVNGVNH